MEIEKMKKQLEFLQISRMFLSMELPDKEKIEVIGKANEIIRLNDCDKMKKAIDLIKENINKNKG